MSDQGKRFATLFRGYSRAHGRYTPKRKKDNGKVEGSAITSPTSLTMGIVDEHLAGYPNPGIGVIPLRDDDSCYWGAIDVDVRGVDPAALAGAVAKQALPLVVCRSKSFGAHLYLFLLEPVDADTLRDKLAEMAAVLGHGGVEIFPKQSNRANDEDFGNWINLPYYGATGDPTDWRHGRVCVLADGRELDLPAFLDYAERMRVPAATITGYSAAVQDTGLFEEGPPCLQHLAASGGFPEGTRNDGMVAVATYLKKRWPDDWESKIQEYNAEMCSPALRAEEIQTITKSVKRKEYTYRCKQAPLNAHCQRRECLRRDYGIGESGYSGGIQIGQLIKYTTGPGDPVKWAVEMNGRRVMVDNDTLYNRDSFNRFCMAELSLIPVQMPPARWLKTLQELIANADVVELPQDAGPSGQLWEHVQMFCTQKAVAKKLEEVWSGRPYKAEDGSIHFRSVDLFAYLDARRVDYARSPQNVYHLLKQNGGKSKPTTVGGKTMNLWSLPPLDEVKQEVQPAPEQEEVF